MTLMEDADAVSGTLATGLVDMARGAGAHPSTYQPLYDAVQAGAAKTLDDALVPSEAEWKFWEAASRDEKMRDLPAAGPPNVRQGTWGDVELAVTSAPDVRSALSTLAATSDVLHGVDLFHFVSREDGSASVVYDSPHTRNRDPGAMAAELALGMIVELVRRLTGEPKAAPRAAWLMGRPHARIATLSQTFGCAVHVGAVQDRLDLPAELLSMPVRTADARIHALALRVIAFQRTHRSRFQTSYGARRALVDVLTRGEPVLDGLAAALGMRPRALKSRLAREETNLRQLVDDARRRAAEHLLLSGATPSQTQEKLGYSDLASFRRACRRWWGVGPQARRAMLRAAPPATAEVSA